MVLLKTLPRKVLVGVKYLLNKTFHFISIVLFKREYCNGDECHFLGFFVAHALHVIESKL